VDPHLRYAIFLTACLAALGAGFGAGMLLIPPAVEPEPRIAATLVPAMPAAPTLQTPQFVDRDSLPQASPPQEAEATVATAGSEPVGPADTAETKPPTEPVVMDKPSSMEGQAVVEPPPAPVPSRAQRPALQRPAAATARTTHARPPTPAKSAKQEPRGKRPSEALRTVRRFGDDLQDIPVSAYAADGTRRSIVIRPTSIQDVYYYSVPR
jgi:hypothetical protein